MIRKLDDWVIDLAEYPRALCASARAVFIRSLSFPVPQACAREHQRASLLAHGEA